MPLYTAKCNDSVRMVGNAEVIRSPSTLRPAVQKQVWVHRDELLDWRLTKS